TCRERRVDRGKLRSLDQLVQGALLGRGQVLLHARSVGPATDTPRPGRLGSRNDPDGPGGIDSRQVAMAETREQQEKEEAGEAYAEETPEGESPANPNGPVRTEERRGTGRDRPAASSTIERVEEL